MKKEILKEIINLLKWVILGCFGIYYISILGLLLTKKWQTDTMILSSIVANGYTQMLMFFCLTKVYGFICITWGIIGFVRNVYNLKRSSTQTESNKTTVK